MTALGSILPTWLWGISPTPEQRAKLTDDQIRLGQLVIQLPGVVRAMMKADAELDYIRKHHENTGTQAPTFNGKTLAQTRSLLDIVNVLITDANNEVVAGARAATEAGKVVEGREWRIENLGPPDIAAFPIIAIVAIIVGAAVFAWVAYINRPSQVIGSITNGMGYLLTVQAYIAAWWAWIKGGQKWPPPSVPDTVPHPTPADKLPSIGIPGLPGSGGLVLVGAALVGLWLFARRPGR